MLQLFGVSVCLCFFLTGYAGEFVPLFLFAYSVVLGAIAQYVEGFLFSRWTEK